MLHWLLAPFDEALMRRALVEVLILSLACGPLGVWIVLHRQSYAAESMAHAMLPGLVIAALVGAPLLLGAVGGVLVGAATIALAGRDERLGGDVGVAVAVSTLFGLGGMLALSPAVPPRLGELLFGDLLGVSGADLAQAAVLAAITATALALGRRALTLTTFDTASGDGRLMTPTRNTTRPPRLRKPARARTHQLGRTRAATRAARVAPRVVTEPRKPKAEPPMTARRSAPGAARAPAERARSRCRTGRSRRFGEPPGRPRNGRWHSR